MAEMTTKTWTVEEMRREGLDPRRYEIVGGELVELGGNDMRGALVEGRLEVFLGGFLQTNPIGVMLAHQRFRLPVEPRRERVPDLCVLMAEHIEPSMPEIIDGVPDLAIEIISPTDEDADVAAKANEYLEHGAREVWVVRPSFEIVTVHRPNEAARALDTRHTLETGVPPGFSLPLDRLFAPLPVPAQPKKGRARRGK